MKPTTDIPRPKSTFLLKQRKLLLTLLCSFGLLLTSCGDSSTGPGNGNGNGNDNGNGEPPEATFANVQEIFTDNCGNCHIGQAQNGVRLDGYDNIMNSNGQQYEGPVVVEGEPDNSPLVDKIEENPDEGERMPLNGTPLTEDEISLIRDWIDDGAQDN
ncbi:c-type cytochrome domain-containing protein [Fodinibius sp.]|uniref:c-type cytochrome domain-containing protein n=1 Tax=Fodinibius sp. TaxID=1872440 RepID=UPI00356151F8